MLTFSDSKSMAKALRKGLSERQIDITHADSLELVARQFGFGNWNMLSARIDSTADSLALPDGWIASGGRPELYRLGRDPSMPGAIKISSRDSGLPHEASATVMQSIAADDYVGKTLRLSGELRSRDAGEGCLWMRVDPVNGGRYLRFDNMMRRKTDGTLKGDSDWVARSIVLDVPEGAGTIHCGVLLVGSGELWGRKLTIEEVDPATVTTADVGLPRRPTNLGFGEAP
jgi:hypothetical protein